MNNPCDRIAFWRLWRTLGKAVWAVWTHMQSKPTEDSHQKGKRWQSEFEYECHSRGLVVEQAKGREDFVVNGLKVQCKAVDRNEGGIDISNMRPVKSNNGMRGYLRTEADVFALRHKDSVFLIPSDVLDRGNGVLRGRVSLQEIQEFKDCWGVFSVDYVPAIKSRQHYLFVGGQDGR
jgi:hypothetical protein